MRKPLARLFLGWLLMLVGGCLLIESGLANIRDSSRAIQAVLGLAGLAVFTAGVMLRRVTTRPAR